MWSLALRKEKTGRFLKKKVAEEIKMEEFIGGSR
jgi:hypothetical protein